MNYSLVASLIQESNNAVTMKILNTKFAYLILSVFLALGSILGIGCTKKENTPPAAQSAPTVIEIGSVGDTMAFDKTTIEAKAGTRVTLVLRNNATSPAMKHNWILLQQNASIEQVAQAGLAAGEAKDYVPDSKDILVYTKLTGPGSTVSVGFTVPAPGNYPYFCSFPGHYVMMRGILKSVP